MSDVNKQELTKRESLHARLGGKVEEVSVLLYSAYYAAIDKTTPTWVRVLIFACFAYLLMPIDIIPDVVPGLGLLDDVLVLLGTMGVIGSKIEADHVFEAKHRLKKLTA